jgi:hypothetical protein
MEKDIIEKGQFYIKNRNKLRFKVIDVDETRVEFMEVHHPCIRGMRIKDFLNEFTLEKRK